MDDQDYTTAELTKNHCLVKILANYQIWQFSCDYNANTCLECASCDKVVYIVSPYDAFAF